MKGFFRLWLVLSGFWVLFASLVTADGIGGEVSLIEIFEFLLLAIGPPWFVGLVVFGSLWIRQGFKSDK